MPWDNVRGWVVGPWWLRLALGPYGNGWSIHAFRRVVAMRPIDYSQAPFVNGKRTWGFPRIASLDLRKVT
jgi:hypothetical protein